jgi:hypothetical protein
MATSSERLASLAAIAVLAAFLPARAAFGQAAVQGGPLPGPLPLFPPNNWWNVDVSAAPLDPNSAAFISFIGVARGLHPDFGGDSSPHPEIYGFPYVVVSGTEPLEPVVFDYADESDAGAPGRPPGYPIPADARTQPKWIEGGYPGNVTVGGDKHMLIVDKDNRILFETFDTRFNTSLSRWEAGSGAVFSLDSNQRRPDGWTSADAAGLAILPGLVRYDEVYGPDPIRHAFRFTVRATNGYVYPGSHRAGSTPGAPPMGTRLRLKTSKDISGYAAPVQKIFQAMKTYGLIVADNGSDMYVQGTYDTRWDNNLLNPNFGSLKAGDFEVVQLGWQPPLLPPSGHLAFYTLPPCRIVDTRNAPGSSGGPALAPGWQRIFTVAEACGVPAGAKAVSVNLTVVASAPGYLSLFPGDAVHPGSSNLNFGAGQIRANNAVLALAGDGTGSVNVFNGSTGTVQVIIDVNGYFQ